jgi:hypothetical protein
MTIKVNEAGKIAKNSFEKHNYSHTRKISAAYSENRMEHIYTVCGQNTKTLNVKIDGTRTYL